MARLMLNDAFWSKLTIIQHQNGIYHKPGLRMMSAAGNSSKIHMATDAHGLSIQFDITAGQVHDCKIAPEFSAQLPPADFTIADRGYDSADIQQI